VIFDRPQHSFKLLTALLYAISKTEILTVFDIGGSLGSTFYQHRKFFESNIHVWNIIEQKKFVTKGNRDYSSDLLRFEDALPDTIDKESSFFLLSSTLQYLENPYDYLENISDLKPKFIFIDKTPFSTDNNDYLTIQHVNEPIYKATYPAWHFSESKLLISLKDYEPYFTFNTYESMINDCRNFTSTFKGFFLKRVGT
jgi:putative methyltransferase (TIGR04325 family)